MSVQIDQRGSRLYIRHDAKLIKYLTWVLSGLPCAIIIFTIAGWLELTPAQKVIYPVLAVMLLWLSAVSIVTCGPLIIEADHIAREVSLKRVPLLPSARRTISFDCMRSILCEDAKDEGLLKLFNFSTYSARIQLKKFGSVFLFATLDMHERDQVVSALRDFLKIDQPQ